MPWIKKKQLFEPLRNVWWSQFYGIAPTPHYIADENIIRIFFATSDKNKFGRITYMDVNADNPSEIIYQHDDYILDIGEPGCFDDCGVLPSAITVINDETIVYYLGFQRSFQVPYLLFAGAAKWKDKKLLRISKTPILERTSEESTIRSATTIIPENNNFKMWYNSASHWEKMEHGIFKEKFMPIYTIRYATSNDGFNWNTQNNPVINYKDDDEFGFGRPWVIKDVGIYKMWYSVRRRNTSYRIGYAESTDSINWVRKDEEVGIDISKIGWDSEMICYPAVIKVKQKLFLFYNGNNNGESGFGYAEWNN